MASAASCFAITFAAAAAERGIPIHSMTVTGAGHVGHRDDGRFGFVAFELTPRIQTDREFVAAAERTARATHAGCIVTGALDVPVHVVPRVTAVDSALV